MTGKVIYISIFILLMFFKTLALNANDLKNSGLYVIPYPQEVYPGGENFSFEKDLTIVLSKKASEEDIFTAKELIKDLKKEWNIDAVVSENKGEYSVILNSKSKTSTKKPQSYEINVLKNEVQISSSDASGLFYGTQTFIQLIKKLENSYYIPGMKIIDWPDVEHRAAHYDTKHHQDKYEYVKDFIKDLSRYKINQLVWEWEDKLAYESHPEIGAPGAFTIKEMQDLTKFARQYHVEIVPLVQGLGHVSFILKWKQYMPYSEIPASNWEFCPLKEGTYDVLFDLWDEAIKATPGSEYIHIGSDETFELAHCDACKAKAKEIGNSGIYLTFINKSAEYLQSKGRKVMAWERPMGWAIGSSPAVGIKPAKNLVLTESYHYETPDFKYAKEAGELGYEIYAYDPNPGIEPLFLPYKYRENGANKNMGSLENSYNFLTSAITSGAFDGMINTSWDDSGLHNQMWMLSFITSAEYSWSSKTPELDDFEESFYKNYYGENVMDMDELYYLLNEGAYYYAWTMERNVWHHGEIGKTHLPDLPRNDNMEYDPYWNAEYKEKVAESKAELGKMKRALQIIENNKKIGVKHAYDFELYRTIAELIQHTCLTYLDLSQLERTITEAHRATYIDKELAYNKLVEAKELIEASLKRRATVYNELVRVWEETRLPKGMSTPDKKYHYEQDRARHYANRTADMSYLIYDEQILDMEGYLKDLEDYMAYYKKLWLD